MAHFAQSRNHRTELLMEADTQQTLERFKRQYFQLIDLQSLSWPEERLLRPIGAQDWIYLNMFDADHITYHPSLRYRSRVLKKLLQMIENAIEDPEEDEISDDLSSALALLLSQPQPSETAAAQEPSYVTYTYPNLQGRDRTITLLESRNVIASEGTTGRRTWEAALHLTSYLTSVGMDIVSGKRVLELGAGTGLVSILCARWLGARHVTATDGDDSVIEDLQKNIFLNGLEQTPSIHAKVLRWGQYMEECEDGSKPHYDVILGADITYDASVIPALVATFRELFLLNRHVEIIIAVGMRNTETFEAFAAACSVNGFTIAEINFPVESMDRQSGPFYNAIHPIRIFQIKSKRCFYAASIASWAASALINREK